MSLHDEFNDFDDDLDDILLSDDETTKKSKVIITATKEDIAVAKGNHTKNANPLVNGTPQIQKSANKAKLFDDEIDPLAMIDTAKPSLKNGEEPSKKSAKSVLDSLLNPVTELDDFSFNKTVAKPKDTLSTVNSTSKIDNKSSKDDDFLQSSGYRPSSGIPKIIESSKRVDSKRTVHFSNDALVDPVELDASLSLRGRPVTAPSTANEVARSRFVSRFEEAELSDTLPKHSDYRFNSESEPSLWRPPVSDDFLNSSLSGAKLKNNDDDLDHQNKDGNSRSNPKQKLNEFLQTSNDDMFSHSPNDQSRKSSTEDLAAPVNRVILDEPYSNRRMSIPTESSFERPKTVHGHFDNTDMIDYGRRSSVQADLLFDRPRTGHGRLDSSQNRSDANRIDRSDADLRLKNLQSERDDLLYKLEGITKRSKEEIEIIEGSYKNRLELMEENIQRKEKRFKEEIDILSSHNKQKLQMLEDERLEMRSELSRRHDEIEEQKRNEISRIKEQHRMELDKMKHNHDDLIERLRHARTEEDVTIRLAQPTTAQLQSVLTQVSNGAQDLATLKQQLLDQMNLQIKEKDTELKLKNESLRLLEEELNNQKHENMKERERLQSLISKLDIQLKEQAKQSDEERWYMRQEQNKLSAMQSSLEKERERILLEKDQNKSSQEEFRAKMLEEQKQLFDKVYEEKRSLAEERAKLTREIAKWSESSQLTNVKKTQESAELDGVRAALAEERRDIDAMRAQIVKEREEYIQKNSQISSLNYDLKLKSEKLHQMETELISKESIIDAKEKGCRQFELNGEEALKKSKGIQNSHQEQLSNIQRQLTILAEKEKKINQEQVELEKRRTIVVSQEKSSVCPRCSNSLRDSAIGGSLSNLNRSMPKSLSKPPADMQYNNYHDQSINNSIEYSQFITGQMEEDRLISSIRRAADEDRDYLEHERAYLRSLTSTPDQWRRNQIRS